MVFELLVFMRLPNLDPSRPQPLKLSQHFCNIFKSSAHVLCAHHHPHSYHLFGSAYNLEILHAQQFSPFVEGCVMQPKS